MTRKLTTEEFISRARDVHGDLYDYTKTDYKHSSMKVVIGCKKHGDFMQIPSNHLIGKGCSACATHNKLTTDDFISRSIAIHGDLYDYSKVDYKNSHKKVVIVCKEHGDFLQTPNNHLQGRGCPSCLKFTTREFIDKSIAIHGDLYDYSKVDYKNIQTKVLIGCEKHGDFEQRPDNHLRGQGCPVCAKYNFESLSEVLKNKYKGVISLAKGQDIIGIVYKYKFRHTCGYEWMARAADILKRGGCPRCNKKVKHTFESVEKAVKDKHENAITLVEGQVICGVKKKYKFKHVCGYEWSAEAGHIMAGKGCPKCSTTGFKPDKPAVFYILDINGDSKFTGFGISNSYKARLQAHKRNLKTSNCSIVSETLLSAHGSIVQELENYIKQTLQCNNSDIKGFKKESVLMKPEDLLDICKEWLVANGKECSII